jgi:acyl-CoA-binding protein
MSLKDAFDEAAANVKTLTTRPPNEVLLKLYALYKQGSEGEVTGKRPGMLALKDRAKYDAWAEMKGKSQDAARQEYIDLVNSLR